MTTGTRSAAGRCSISPLWLPAGMPSPEFRAGQQLRSDDALHTRLQPAHEPEFVVDKHICANRMTTILTRSRDTRSREQLAIFGCVTPKRWRRRLSWLRQQPLFFRGVGYESTTSRS